MHLGVRAQLQNSHHGASTNGHRPETNHCIHGQTLVQEKIQGPTRHSLGLWTPMHSPCPHQGSHELHDPLFVPSVSRNHQGKTHHNGFRVNSGQRLQLRRTVITGYLLILSLIFLSKLSVLAKKGCFITFSIKNAPVRSKQRVCTSTDLSKYKSLSCCNKSEHLIHGQF